MKQVKACSLAMRASNEAEHLPKELVSLPSTSNTHAICPQGMDYDLCPPQTSPGNCVGDGELPSAETTPRTQLITEQFGASWGSAAWLWCLEGYCSSSTDIVSVSLMKKKPVTAITLKRLLFKVTILAWEITCPNKIAPILHALKEQMGWSREGTGNCENLAL